MKPRFQADQNLRKAIRLGVLRREPSIDFRSSHDGGLDGLTDPEVIRRCAEDGRILVSHDTHSMPLHFHEFVETGFDSGGVLLVAQDTPVSAAIESILLIWLASEPDEWRNRLVWLPL